MEFPIQKPVLSNSRVQLGVRPQAVPTVHTQQMRGGVRVTPRLEDPASCYQMTKSFSRSPTSLSLPLHDFSQSRGNKTTHNPTTIWRLQPSKHEMLACTGLAAAKTNIPLSLLLFKSKARMIIQKHKHTDTLALQEP